MFLGIPTLLNQVSQFIKKEHHYIMLFYTKCIFIFSLFYLFQSQAKKQQVAYCANTRWHPWVAASCVQHLSWPQRGAVKPLKAHALVHTHVSGLSFCLSSPVWLPQHALVRSCLYITKESVHVDGRSVKGATAMSFTQHLLCLLLLLQVLCLSV